MIKQEPFGRANSLWLTISPLNPPISRYSKDIIRRKKFKKGENLTKGGEVERTND